MTPRSLVLFALAACGDQVHTVSPDAPRMPDAAPDAPPACQVVADLGAQIMEMNVASAVPTPQGGGIPDGTYQLTASSRYTGAAGASGPTGTVSSSTSYLTSGHSDVVTTSNGTPTYNAYTLATNGTTLVLTQTCPTTSVLNFDGYTHAGDVVTLIDTIDARSLEYTRMP